MKTTFIPFSKVLEAQQEVWGLVTAQVPDKENEVCDYDGSKPYYQAVIDEFTKATDGGNLFPLRAMHQLKAAGKGIGVDFRDADKEIHMGFKVVDKDEWQKVLEQVYTGFSHGGSVVGKMWKDPDFKDCQRYIVSPAEVSLVDNPCLGVAHYTMVRANGAIEIVKLRSVYDIPIIGKGGKTKEVAGEELPPSAFAYVGDPDKLDTWHLPIKFSTEEKTKEHIRMAISMFSLTQGIPDDKKDEVWHKIVAAAKKYDIQVSGEKGAKAVEAKPDKVALVLERVIPKALKAKLAEWKLEKGMYAVGRMAEILQDLCYLTISAKYEAEIEDDDSDIPEALLEDLKNLIETYRDLVTEETDELAAYAEAGGQGGSVYMATTVTDITKAAKGQMKKAAAAHEKLAAIHADKAEEHGAMAKAMESCKAADAGHEHCKVAKSFHKAMAAHEEKTSKEHGKIADAMTKAAEAEDDTSADAGNEKKAAEVAAAKATADAAAAKATADAATAKAAAVKVVADAAAAAVKAVGGDQKAQDEAAAAVTKTMAPAAPAAAVVPAAETTDLFKGAMDSVAADYFASDEFKAVAKSVLAEQFKAKFGTTVQPTGVRVIGGNALIPRAGQEQELGKGAGLPAADVPLDMMDMVTTEHTAD